MEFLVNRTKITIGIHECNSVHSSVLTMQTTYTSTTATRVNLGPLTTTFNPPSDCSSLRFITDNEVFMGASIGYGCYDSVTGWLPCFPHPSGAFDCSTVHGNSVSWFPCSPTAISDKRFSCPADFTTERNGFSLIHSCYPPKFASSFGLTGDDVGKWTSQPLVYSPGLACPSGYLPQCTIERSKGLSNPAMTYTMAPADNAVWSILNDDEIAIGCCPS